jgi:hypothetical protein
MGQFPILQRDKLDYLGESSRFSSYFGKISGGFRFYFVTSARDFEKTASEKGPVNEHLRAQATSKL